MSETMGGGRLAFVQIKEDFSADPLPNGLRAFLTGISFACLSIPSASTWLVSLPLLLSLPMMATAGIIPYSLLFRGEGIVKGPSTVTSSASDHFGAAERGVAPRD